MRTQQSTNVTSDIFEMLDYNNDLLLDYDWSILTMKEDTQIVQITRIQQ